MRRYEKSFSTPLLAQAFIDGLTYLGYEDVDVDETIYVKNTDDSEEWIVKFCDLIDDEECDETTTNDQKPTWEDVIEISQQNHNDDITDMENEGGHSWKQVPKNIDKPIVIISGSKTELPKPQKITKHEIEEDEYDLLEVGHVKLPLLLKKKTNENTKIEG